MNEYKENTKYNIAYYGADYPVDSLVQRMNDNEIIIPHFQREYVWKANEASRFIESLILRLPVPSIFLLRDNQTNKLIIIDGQQRLKTLLYFFKGEFPDGKKFYLRNVTPEYINLTYENLDLNDQLELKNSIIHSIIIMDEDNSDAPYHLFERLNTTGTPLTSQEIRSSLYFGPFNDLLRELSEYENWNKIIGNKKDNRYTDQAYILRLIALYYDLDYYTGNMKSFLNQFMIKNRNLDDIYSSEIKEIFCNSIDILSMFFQQPIKPFNITYFEPLFYWVSKTRSLLKNKEIIQNIMDNLSHDETYMSFCRSSTTSKKSLFNRIEYIKSHFEF